MGLEPERTGLEALNEISKLVDAGIIRDTKLPLKVLGEGDLTTKLNVTAAKFSASAKEKIEKAGGSATVVAKEKWVRTPGKKAAPAKKSGDESGE